MDEENLYLRWQAFSLPKQGNSFDEYEDAFACNSDLGLFAIADGASESTFAKEWAKILTESFVTERHPYTDWEEWLPPLQEKWRTEVGHRSLSWYAQEKMESGAFATFLGLQFEEIREGQRAWKAIAVGDCCLFHIHEDHLVTSFPIHDSGAFNSHPALVNSQIPPFGKGKIIPKTVLGSVKSKDILLLMSDALALWMMNRIELKEKPWRTLVEMKEEKFLDWIPQLRSQRLLRNDDVTLLIIEFSPEEYTVSSGQELPT
jgi:hypothetical protein